MCVYYISHQVSIIPMYVLVYIIEVNIVKKKKKDTYSVYVKLIMNQN